MKRLLETNELRPNQVYIDMGKILFSLAPEFADRCKILKPLVSIIFKDLEAYVDRDPAAHGYYKLVYHEYLCFKAIMYYRVANALLKSGYDSKEEKELIERAARRITEAAKVMTGVDINPKAEIGEGFVIDHGMGVSIGATTAIGDNVTILNGVVIEADPLHMGVVIGETSKLGSHVTIKRGVVLGGPRAAYNPIGKRHPTIGNNVQLCGNAKVFGPVTIGDGCFIGAGATVTEDLAPGMKKVLKSEHEVTKLITDNRNSGHVVPNNRGFIARLMDSLTRFAAMLI